MTRNDHRLWAGSFLLVAGAVLSFTDASAGAYMLVAVMGVLIAITSYSSRKD